MPTLNGITASPTTVTPGQSSLITVSATADPDESLRVRGELVGAVPARQVEVSVLLDNPPLRFTLDPATAQPGDILVTAPDGGSLTPVSGQPGKFTFVP